jgi:low temperature requirement protein LtrA
MTTMQDQAAEPQEIMRVSAIELFFDLVFVYTALAWAIAGLQWGGVTELGAMTALILVLLAVEQQGVRAKH